MQRPDTIWVGAFPYSVVYDKAKIDAKSVEQRAHLLGSSNHHDLIITLDDSVAEQVIRDTLLHEILHCTWATSGLTEMVDLTEEQIAAAVAPQLVYVFRANPELVEYLTYTREGDSDAS